jgi:hypothetical protein
MTDHLGAATRATREVGQHEGSPVTMPAGTAGDDCPGCGSHPMAVSACLLALTLLVLFWSLSPPKVRRLPPRAPRRRLTLAAVHVRRVPALSLAELSILRT